MKKTGFATIGTSKITKRFLNASKECEDFKLVAVYSRDIKKAEMFAEEQGAERFYDSVDVLAADIEVEAVYVASPNYMHYEHTMKLLKAGKHVICEKAIASNYREAEEMIRTAREKNLVLLEAVRPVYDPGMQAVKACRNWERFAGQISVTASIPVVTTASKKDRNTTSSAGNARPEH